MPNASRKSWIAGRVGFGVPYSILAGFVVDLRYFSDGLGLVGVYLCVLKLALVHRCLCFVRCRRGSSLWGSLLPSSGC